MTQDDPISPARDAQADLQWLDRLARVHALELAERIDSAAPAPRAAGPSPRTSRPQPNEREQIALHELREEMKASEALACKPHESAGTADDPADFDAPATGWRSRLRNPGWTIALQVGMAVLGVWLSIMVYWVLS